MIKILENFYISSRNIIIAEILHQENGLSKGTILHNKDRNMSWEIVSRLFFSEGQKIFENESVEMMLLSFTNVEKLENSKKQVLEKEQNNIFQYAIKGIFHNKKPLFGEVLEIFSL